MNDSNDNAQDASKAPEPTQAPRGRRFPSKKPAKPRGLTHRQKRFVEIYDGRGIISARLAGFQGSDDVVGKTAYDLLRNPRISPLIKEREDREIATGVKTRQDRMRYWSAMMDDPNISASDRLQASALLARACGDFVEKLAIVDTISISERIRQGRLRAR
jgi:hypothetical protein